MRSGLKSLIAVAWLVSIAQHANGQSSTSLAYDPGEGLVIKRDSTFAMHFRFRMQDRASFNHQAGLPGESSIAFQVRRLRFKLEGHAISPRLKYKVQLGLSANDMDIGDGGSGSSPLLDAAVYYAISRKTQFGFGQAKLPGGRQALISSSELEMPERPLANGAFSADRDLGAFADHQLHLGKQVMRVRAAIANGEGRSTAAGDLGLCYTGRMEWLPLGAFTSGGDYEEGDLVREASPKLSIATAFSTDRHARRSRAQLGMLLPQGKTRTIDTFYADAMFKHNGWSAQCEYGQRYAEGNPVVRDTTLHTAVAVNEGWGITGQLSRMLGGAWQVAGRYSTYRPGSRVDAYYSQLEEASLGWSYYVREHRIKVQSAISYTWEDGDPSGQDPGSRYGMILQVELGI